MRCQSIFLQKLVCFCLKKEQTTKVYYSHPYIMGVLYTHTVIHLKSETSNWRSVHRGCVSTHVVREAKTKLSSHTSWVFLHPQFHNHFFLCKVWMPGHPWCAEQVYRILLCKVWVLGHRRCIELEVNRNSSFKSMGTCAPTMYRTEGLQKSFVKYGCLGTHDVRTDFFDMMYGKG